MVSGTIFHIADKKPVGKRGFYHRSNSPLFWCHLTLELLNLTPTPLNNDIPLSCRQHLVCYYAMLNRLKSLLYVIKKSICLPNRHARTLFLQRLFKICGGAINCCMIPLGGITQF